jgi:hypothetical protein
MYKQSELIRYVNAGQISRVIGADALMLYIGIDDLRIYRNRYDGALSLRGVVDADDLTRDDVREILEILCNEEETL